MIGHERISRVRCRPKLDSLVPLGVATIGVVAVGAGRIVGIEAVLYGLASTLGAVAMVAFALRWPSATVLLGLVFGQLMGQDVQLLLPEALRTPQVGNLQLRYFDPFLLGIVGATVIRAIRQRQRWEILRPLATLMLFVVWLIVQVVRGGLIEGFVRSVGEFRTYYQYLLLVPFIALSFGTEQSQRSLFRLLVNLGLAFLPISLLVGWGLSGLAIGPSSRWLSSSSNLAALLAFGALLVSQEFRVVGYRRGVVWLAGIAFVTITILNSHRSVWAATAVLGLILAGKRVIKPGKAIGLLSALASALFLSILTFPGGSAGLSDFIETRALAFTDFERDSTASWRYNLWIQTIDEVAARPLTGQGLGHGFALSDLAGQTVTTSPHNLYLTIAYHSGLVGLLLYIALLLSALVIAIRCAGSNMAPLQQAVGLTAVVVLAASHTYYFAYAFDYFTWLFIGLAFAANTTWRASRGGSTLE